MNKNILVNKKNNSIERISRDDRNIQADLYACKYLEKYSIKGDSPVTRTEDYNTCNSLYTETTANLYGGMVDAYDLKSYPAG